MSRGSSIRVPSVYLAGPIHHADDSGYGWRNRVGEIDGFDWVDPLEKYDVPAGDLTLVDDQGGASGDPTLVAWQAIVEEDKAMIDDADAVLVGWTDQVSSAGTPMEILYAYEEDTPVVVWERDVRDSVSIWIEYHARAQSSSLYYCVQELENLTAEVVSA